MVTYRDMAQVAIKQDYHESLVQKLNLISNSKNQPQTEELKYILQENKE